MASGTTTASSPNGASATTIIELHYWKGYKLREIAVILGCAPNTVSQVLAHARHALKRAMTK